MEEWIRNFVTNFSIGDLFNILSTTGVFGFALAFLKFYNSYRKLKDKDVRTVVKEEMQEVKKEIVSELVSHVDGRINEVDNKIAQVNTNVVLNSIGNTAKSDRITAMIDNSNLTQEKKEEVKEIVKEEVKTEEEKKEERISQIDAM